MTYQFKYSENDILPTAIYKKNSMAIKMSLLELGLIQAFVDWIFYVLEWLHDF